MAYEILGFSFTLAAAADLSTHQFKFIVVDTNGEAALAGAGVDADGVLQNEPEAGQAATVTTDGVTKAVVGAGGVTAADLLETDATGQVITLAAGETVGRALETGAAGDVISILLK